MYVNSYTETALYSLAQQLIDNARGHVADARSAAMSGHDSMECVARDEAMAVLHRVNRDVEDEFSRHLSRWAR